MSPMITSNSTPDTEEERQSSERKTLLKSHTVKWTGKDYIFLVQWMLIKFGHGIEIYLPGIITQQVSCEIDISPLGESVLGVILYVFMALATLISMPLAKKLGNKFVLYLSLYSSIIFAVVCAIVPNYWTLLISRALTGICVGLTAATSGVYFTQNVSSIEIVPTGAFLQGFAIALGSTWIGFLGWCLLDLINWREFILCTSIPWFIPPIIILHCNLEKSDSHEELLDSDSRKKEHFKEPTDFNLRLCKGSLFIGLLMVFGYGSILLVPQLMKSNNFENSESPLNSTTVEYDPCQGVVHGTEYLVIAAISGGSQFFGRYFGFLLRKCFKFRVLQSVIGALTAVSCAVVLLKPGLWLQYTCLGIAKMVYGMQSTESLILLLDAEYFGSDGIAASSTLMFTVAYVGGIGGVALASFLNPYTTTLMCVVSSSMLVCVVLSMTGVQH